MKCTTLKCTEAQRLLSPYLDGAISGAEMHALQQHMQVCPGCQKEYRLLRQTQQLLVAAGRPEPPADLGLRLRLAISHEATSRRARFDGLRVRLENTLHAFMVPATAGLMCALVIFGLVMGILGVPGQLQANNDDVPLMLNSGPELQQTAFSTTLTSMNADSLVIEAYVDANGRVQDYKILSDPGDAQELMPQVKRMLIFTTFRPAMSMGRPISSKAVLSFAKVSVKG